ncbi:MAG: YitT family protein, partial [Bacteroidota bacterium]
MKRKTIDLISEYAQILLGILLCSIGLKAFLLPNGFLDGGVTGIAILISEVTGWDVSLLLVVTSIPFLVIA